ncbi:MAG: energy transducer TonB, partial [Thermodesulfovibrionales bacterium]
QRYIMEHFSYIRDIITKNISYPFMARKMGWSGKVTVSFVINEDGSVRDIKIIESSGFDVLDRNAADTVKKVSPFPKPPVSAEIIVPVVYRLN